MTNADHEEQAATVVTAFVFCFTMDFYLCQCSVDMRECIGETNVDDSNCWSNSPVKADAKCCDICASDCGSKFLPTFDKEESNYTFTKSKVVSRQQKELLKSKLLEYITKLRHNCKNHVLFPNVHLEFSMFYISQVLENCAHLFSVLDIHNCVEIWRTEYAQQILTILSDVFTDIDPDDLDFTHTDDMDDLDSTQMTQMLTYHLMTLQICQTLVWLYACV